MSKSCFEKRNCAAVASSRAGRRAHGRLGLRVDQASQSISGRPLLRFTLRVLLILHISSYMRAASSLYGVLVLLPFLWMLRCCLKLSKRSLNFLWQPSAGQVYTSGVPPMLCALVVC